MTLLFLARQLLRVVFAVAVLLIVAPVSATAQGPPDPDPGAITVTVNAETPSVYFFRGIRQEADPKLTFWPNGAQGVRLYAGDGE